MHDEMGEMAWFVVCVLLGKGFTTVPYAAQPLAFATLGLFGQSFTAAGRGAKPAAKLVNHPRPDLWYDLEPLQDRREWGSDPVRSKY